MIRLASIACLACLAPALLAAAQSPVATSAAAKFPAGVQRIAMPGAPGFAASVRVPDGPLVFTAPVGAATTSGDTRAQAERALDALGAALTPAGSDLGHVVRLTAYVADDASVADVESVVAARFAAAPPAFTLVRTPLAVAGARVAFEAVATGTRAPESVEVVAGGAAIVPAGGKIFISGQAERGADLAAAVRLTMAGLHRSLAHLGLKKSDIAQVKAFIRAFGDQAAAMREIAASFDGAAVPPIVLMEWQSDLYTEIELVASARSLAAQPDGPISHAWLPWLVKSPRYCHVAHVAAGTPLIFIGAVSGRDGDEPRAQMKTIFERLGSVLFDAGSSYRHLAKATYYLGHPAARALLGDIRDVYFDPTRPPAASALNLPSLGHPGRAATLDMIAVPAK